MSDNPKMIRFIDSDYKELFQIPDGEKIKITYPPGDERGTIVRACKFMDDHHFRLFADETTTSSFGSVYHICEFAENMEHMGIKYEPDTQLPNVELRAFTRGDEKFYTYNREEGNSCIGHIAGNFGNDGERFNGNWASRENDKNTSEFQSELHSAVYALRKDLLKDYDSMATYCQAHPEAMLDSGETYKRYGFKLETDTRQYYTQCFVDESTRNSRFIIYAYENPAPALEKAQPAFDMVVPFTADESKMFYHNSEAGNLCIGRLRGDFGSGGTEFWHTWEDVDKSRNTPEFKAEFQGVMNTLRKEVLKDLRTTQNYCYKHSDAQLPGDTHYYGFKVETESRQFFVRCTTARDDYFYIWAYDKAAIREQERPVVPTDDKLSQKITSQVATQVYKHTAEYALKNGEIELFHESAKVNKECAKAIDTAIQACNYEQYRYKMSDAVKSVVDDFGFERVNWVLASTIHQHFFDGRFSSSNQKWAKDLEVPNERYPGFTVQTHLAVLDGFINSVRKAHVEMLAESVGSYEKSHNMADRNRLTWFHNDFGTFVPKEGITEQRLLERHNEITEKKSVLAQIRADRKAQKQSSAPKTERNKKKQGLEI